MENPPRWFLFTVCLALCESGLITVSLPANNESYFHCAFYRALCLTNVKDNHAFHGAPLKVRDEMEIVFREHFLRKEETKATLIIGYGRLGYQDELHPPLPATIYISLLVRGWGRHVYTDQGRPAAILFYNTESWMNLFLVSFSAECKVHNTNCMYEYSPANINIPATVCAV